MKLQIFNDMELMKKELIKEMQRHGEEITNYVDKRSDETKLVAAQVIELTQTLSSIKLDFDKQAQGLKNGQTEVLMI